MNRQEFIDTLKRCLTDEGFPTDYVETQCRILTDNINSLTEEQATQYLTEKNIDIILRKLISQDAHLLSQKVVSPAKEAAVPTSDQSTSESEEEIVVADDEQVLPLSDMMQDDLSAGPIATPHRYKRPASISSEYTPCDKPRLLTFLLLVICFPTIVLFLTTAFGLFAGVFLVLAASIFFIVLAIIGIVLFLFMVALEFAINAGMMDEFFYDATGMTMEEYMEWMFGSDALEGDFYETTLE